MWYLSSQNECFPIAAELWLLSPEYFVFRNGFDEDLEIGS